MGTEKYSEDALCELSDDALSIVAATEVMGWAVIDCQLGKFYEYIAGDKIETWAMQHYQFATDETAAFALVDKVHSLMPLLFDLDGGFQEWHAEFMTDKGTPSHYRVFAEADSPSRTRAITIACILAAQKMVCDGKDS